MIQYLAHFKFITINSKSMLLTNGNNYDCDKVPTHNTQNRLSIRELLVETSNMRLVVKCFSAGFIYNGLKILSLVCQSKITHAFYDMKNHANTKLFFFLIFWKITGKLKCFPVWQGNCAICKNIEDQSVAALAMRYTYICY